MTAYSSPFGGDIISGGHSSFEPYSGYHDSSVHSDIPSYAFDHSDHHDFHDHHDHHDFHDQHEHHDFDHHSFDDSYFPGSPHDSSPPGGIDAPPSGNIKDSASDSAPLSMSPTYRRVGRKRRAARPQIE